MKTIIKVIYIFLGTLTFCFGVIGIFIPILPTTPFLILTAFFYLRSSKKMYDWLMNHPKYGPYVKGILLDKAMSLTAKKRTIFTLWLTISISIYIVPITMVKLLLVVIASSVSFYVYNLKTLN